MSLIIFLECNPAQAGTWKECSLRRNWNNVMISMVNLHCFFLEINWENFCTLLDDFSCTVLNSNELWLFGHNSLSLTAIPFWMINSIGLDCKIASHVPTFPTIKCIEPNGRFLLHNRLSRKPHNHFTFSDRFPYFYCDHMRLFF